MLTEFQILHDRSAVSFKHRNDHRKKGFEFGISAFQGKQALIEAFLCHPDLKECGRPRLYDTATGKRASTEEKGVRIYHLSTHVACWLSKRVVICRLPNVKIKPFPKRKTASPNSSQKPNPRPDPSPSLSISQRHRPFVPRRTQMKCEKCNKWHNVCMY